jgi:hypothetical protein
MSGRGWNTQWRLGVACFDVISLGLDHWKADRFNNQIGTWVQLRQRRKALSWVAAVLSFIYNAITHSIRSQLTSPIAANDLETKGVGAT